MKSLKMRMEGGIALVAVLFISFMFLGFANAKSVMDEIADSDAHYGPVAPPAAPVSQPPWMNPGYSGYAPATIPKVDVPKKTITKPTEKERWGWDSQDVKALNDFQKVNKDVYSNTNPYMLNTDGTRDYSSKKSDYIYNVEKRHKVSSSADYVNGAGMHGVKEAQRMNEERVHVENVKIMDDIVDKEKNKFANEVIGYKYDALEGADDRFKKAFNEKFNSQFETIEKERSQGSFLTAINKYDALRVDVAKFKINDANIRAQEAQLAKDRAAQIAADNVAKKKRQTDPGSDSLVIRNRYNPQNNNKGPYVGRYDNDSRLKVNPVKTISPEDYSKMPEGAKNSYNAYLETEKQNAAPVSQQYIDSMKSFKMPDAIDSKNNNKGPYVGRYDNDSRLKVDPVKTISPEDYSKMPEGAKNSYNAYLGAKSTKTTKPDTKNIPVEPW